MAAGLQVGDVLCQRYPIESILGQGGMGAVYKASDLSSKRHWAIKEMTDDFEDEQERNEGIESFKAEADILCELDHPNLPRITHCFSERGRQYIVMDLVEGLTVDRMMHQEPNGRLSLQQVLNIAAQLTDVLSYLHEHNPPIIFRDLKPGNIMVTPKGRVKLIDFGIARFFTKGKKADTRALGTPGYAAPEQYGKGQSDARTDIYALGATLHHALTGVSPDGTMFSFEAPSKLVSSLPQALDEVVLKCCRLQASERWSTVKEFEQALFTSIPSSYVDPDSYYGRVCAARLLSTGLIGKIKSASEVVPSVVPIPQSASANKAAALPSFQRPNVKSAKTTADMPDKNSPEPGQGPFPRLSIPFGKHNASEGALKTSIVLRGPVQGKLEVSDEWLLCRPSEVSGENVKVDIIVRLDKIPSVGMHTSQIKLGSSSMLITCELKPAELSCLSWSAAIILTMLSILPLCGLSSSVILLIMYFAHNKDVRGPLLVFVVISLMIGIPSSLVGYWVFDWLKALIDSLCSS
ncbi:MAG: serine/threonine protein kinase [Candidatus Bruticola sp.]